MIEYFISFRWYNETKFGAGDAYVLRRNPISTMEDLDEIKKEIKENSAEMESVIITFWKRFEEHDS